MNVVLIVVDSLRADHLGCYCYGKNTSPNIDRLAAEGTVFTRTFAPGIPTTPAFTTLFTGLHPYRHGILSHGGDALVDKDVTMLPELAKKAGYTTIAIDNLVVQGNGRGSWFSRGFDYYSAFAYQPFGEQDAQLADRAIRFLNDFHQDDFFLFLHLWAPHTPYSPPEPYKNLHYDAGKTTPEKLQGIKSLAPEYYESFLGDMKFAKPNDFDWIMAQYDGEISYADAQIGRILTHLKSLERWDDTVVVVMSDHGECFGEGGFWFDHHGLYDANLRVASIWKVPGQEAQQNDEFISTEDVLPTLCKLCEWPLPQEKVTGREFAAFGGKVEREHLIGVECSRQASLCWRSEKWKLVLPIDRDVDGNEVPDFYGNVRSSTVQLFDLENDPAETQNVAEQYVDVCEQLLAELHAWREGEKQQAGGHDLILESPLGLPFDEFMGRLSSRKLRG